MRRTRLEVLEASNLGQIVGRAQLAAEETVSLTGMGKALLESESKPRRLKADGDGHSGAIRAALRQAGKPLRIAEIVEATGGRVTVQQVANGVRAMRDVVRSGERSKYRYALRERVR